MLRRSVKRENVVRQIPAQIGLQRTIDTRSMPKAVERIASESQQCVASPSAQPASRE